MKIDHGNVEVDLFYTQVGVYSFEHVKNKSNLTQVFAFLLLFSDSDRNRWQCGMPLHNEVNQTPLASKCTGRSLETKWDNHPRTS